MRIKKITPRFFQDYKRKAKNDLDAGIEFVWRDEEFRRRYYAFTCLAWHAPSKKLLCGTTNFSNDVLHTFDPVTKKFESLNYAAFGKDPFEIKCHRSLAVGTDGAVYGATSCLHGVDQRMEGPGGKLFKLEVASQRFELLGIPKPHDYIQTITLDPKRQMLYGFTYPVFEFFAFSLPERRVKFIQYMESIPHLSALDDAGGYWGTWGAQHCFFRYDPDESKVRFFKHGLPVKCQSLMYRNAGPLDIVLNGGDGYLYIGSEQAELYRLDPQTAKLEYLGRPYPSERLPGLCVGPRGLLLGAGGRDRTTRLFSYDRASRIFTELGAIADPVSGASCFRAHDLIALGNTLYLGETDNPDRGDYLWEIELEG